VLLAYRLHRTSKEKIVPSLIPESSNFMLNSAMFLPKWKPAYHFTMTIKQKPALRCSYIHQRLVDEVLMGKEGENHLRGKGILRA
jgi:hypothetical protein